MRVSATDEVAEEDEAERDEEALHAHENRPCPRQVAA